MKANILVAGLVLATVGAVLLYPTFRGHATGTPVGGVVTPTGAKRVEVVFVLDTTGSMGGLIEAAKEKIWSIASTLAQAQQAPEISMGLVAYRDRGDAYVTQVVDLNRDLDSMYAKLMDFAADGGGDGPEAVNEALEAAIHRVSWSQDPGTYKVVFLVGDAPPHMDYQDDVKYPQVVAAAAAKSIVVNTIQCGSMSETVAPWQHIAALGSGRYFTVEQAGSAVAIHTPFDAQIATLAAELDATRLYYGSADERAAMDAKVAATTRLNEEASVAVRARRGAFNVSESGQSNLLGEHELVADVASGRVDVADVPASALPPAVAGLPAEQQRALLKETAAKREELQRQIGALAAERDAYIETEVEGGRRRRGLARSADLRRGPQPGGSARARLRRRAALLNVMGAGGHTAFELDLARPRPRCGRLRPPGVTLTYRIRRDRHEPNQGLCRSNHAAGRLKLREQPGSHRRSSSGGHAGRGGSCQRRHTPAAEPARSATPSLPLRTPPLPSRSSTPQS